MTPIEAIEAQARLWLHESTGDIKGRYVLAMCAQRILALLATTPLEDK